MMTRALSTVLLILAVAGPAAAQQPPDPRPPHRLEKRDDGKGIQKGREDRRAAPKADPQRKAAGPSVKTAPQTPESRARALSNLYALLATAEDAGTAAAITEAIERYWLDSGSDTVSLLMQRALQAAQEKRLDLAEKLLDAVIDLKPDYAEGFNRRAYVHHLRSDTARALGDLRRALALEPNHYKALDGLAQILNDAGEKKAALKALQQLQTVHPHWQGLNEAIADLEKEIEGQGI